MKTSEDEIRKLLDRYLDGETTGDEEYLLAEFLSGDDMPEDLIPFREMFAAVRKPYEAPGEAEVEAYINEHKPEVSRWMDADKKSKARIAPIVLRIAAVAAVALILLTMTFWPKQDSTSPTKVAAVSKKTDKAEPPLAETQAEKPRQGADKEADAETPVMASVKTPFENESPKKNPKVIKESNANVTTDEKYENESPQASPTASDIMASTSASDIMASFDERSRLTAEKSAEMRASLCFRTE